MKVTTHWDTEHASARLDITQLPTEDVFNPTVNLTNGVHNVRLILLFVFNVKPMSTESSSSQNIFVSVPMDSSKLPMELASHVLMDVLSAHQPLNAMLVSLKPPTMEMEHASVPLELSSELPQMESDIVSNVLNIVTSVETVLHVKHAKPHLFSQLTTLVSAQRITSLTPREIVFHARLVVKHASRTLLVINVKPHWFFKRTTVSKNVALVTSCQVPNVLDAQSTVSDVLQPINATIARMASSLQEEHATLHAQLVLSQTEKPSNVLPATSHAKLVSTIQALAPVVNQEKDICKSPELIKSVSRNVLKVLSHKMESVKFATSNVLNVWVPLETVLLVQLEDTCTTPLVGIIAQESSMPTENVSTNAHLVTSDNQTKNAKHVHQNARLAATTQLA